MEFTQAQFRRAIQSPSRFVSEAERPPNASEGGNPQRPLLEACLKAYFGSGRDIKVPFRELQRRLDRANRRQPVAEGREANWRAVAGMITRFLALDDGEPDPLVYFPRPIARVIGAHELAI